MRLRIGLPLFIAATLVLGCNLALAQEDGRDHDRDRDRGHDREESRENRDADHFYGDHERDAMHGWYAHE